MATVDDLPDEVLEYVLSLLFPYEDLENSKYVSWRWYYAVKNVLAQVTIQLERGINDYRMYWHSYAPPRGHPERIAARYSHAAVVHKNYSMFIFGGGTFQATNFNDLWRFDLSTRTYHRPLSTGSYPPPKSCATFLSHRDKLILFGGWRHNSNSWPQRECALYNQLHVYDVPTNKWTLISGGQSDQMDESPSPNEPPSLARHSATIFGDEMIVFGGIQRLAVAMINSNEVWRLDLQTYKWQRQKTTTTPQPSPRYGQAQVQVDAHNILIVGGCGGPNNIFRDAWLLTKPSNPSESHKPWMWRQVTIKSSLKSSSSPTVHVWCNPGCVIGDKLIVLGPTRANDFQMVKETDNANNRGNDNNQQRAPSPPYRRAPVPAPNNPLLHPPQAQQQQLPAAGEHHQMVRDFNSRAEEERQRLDLEHENILMRMRRFRRRNAGEAAAGSAAMPSGLNMLWGRRAAVRLAAFQDEANNNYNLNSHQDRISPRLQQAHNLLRNGLLRVNENARQGNDRNGLLQPAAPLPLVVRPEVPKVLVNRSNLMAMHVCDLSKVLGQDGGEEPVITWRDPPSNLGCFYGAPEKLILYSLVAGKGELIMFGGLVKEINSEEAMKVSNGLHFLSVPKRII